MTSRERLLTAFRCGTPDRVPVAPFGLGHLDPEGPVAQELIAQTDPLICVGGGGDPFLGKDVPTTTTREGEVTTTVIHTPRGDLVRRHRRTAITSATIEFPFKTPTDAEKFFSLPYEPPDINLEPYWQWRERVGEEALVLVGLSNAVCLPATWFSPEDFCYAWADAPDLLVELTALAAERLNVYVERLCQAGVDAFRIVGGEYVTVQLGPRAVEALLTPFDTELVNLLHRYGALAYYHNHGPIMRYLEALADLGIDALDPLEAPPWGDCDLAEAKSRLQGRVCLVGNLDDMEILEKRSPEEVQALARERLAQAGPDGFVLGGTASGTYTEPAARNFLALVEVAEEMARRR